MRMCTRACMCACVHVVCAGVCRCVLCAYTCVCMHVCSWCSEGTVVVQRAPQSATSCPEADRRAPCAPSGPADGPGREARHRGGHSPTRRPRGEPWLTPCVSSDAPNCDVWVLGEGGDFSQPSANTLTYRDTRAPSHVTHAQPPQNQHIRELVHPSARGSARPAPPGQRHQASAVTMPPRPDPGTWSRHGLRL